LRIASAVKKHREGDQHNIVGQLFPELSYEFKDLAGLTALAMLCNHAAAAAARQMSQEAFIAGVRADFQEKRLRKGKKSLSLLGPAFVSFVTHNTPDLSSGLTHHFTSSIFLSWISIPVMQRG